MRLAGLILSTLLLFHGSLNAENLKSQWTLETGSTLSHPLVCADFHPEDGQESLILDSKTGLIECISGSGRSLWIQDALFDKSSTATPAITLKGENQQPMILVASSEGIVLCLNGVDGNERWRNDSPMPGLCSLSWADFDNDGVDEAIVAGELGVVVYEQNGTKRWHTAKGDDSSPLVVGGALAVGDVDGDFYPEIFGTTITGPFSLSADGTFYWQKKLEGVFTGDVILGDLNNDNLPELYCSTETSPALFALDAAMGTALWKRPLLQLDAGPLHLALGTRDDGGMSTLVIGAADGFITSLNSDGAFHWQRKIGEGTVYPSTGDVDGDGLIEVIAAGDGQLVALQHKGGIQWQISLPGAAVGPAVLTDIDNNHLSDMVVAMTQGIVSAYTFGGRYIQDNFPWPMTRHNSAGTSAPSFIQTPYLGEVPPEYLETVPMLRNPEFEAVQPTDERIPLHWARGDVSAGTWQITTDNPESGKHALQLNPESGILSIVSRAMELSQELTSLEAAILVKGGPDARAMLDWYGDSGLIQTNPLEGNPDSTWSELYCAPVDRPAGARWVSLRVESEAPSTWDTARVDAQYARIPAIRIFHNQVGYELNNPKNFTAWTSFMPANNTFFLVNNKGKLVYESTFSGPGEVITGAYGNPWPGYYWRGEFTDFVEPGTYQIRVQMDELNKESHSFLLDRNVLFSEVFDYPFKALRAWRSEGGWEDGFGSAKTTHAYALLFATEFYGVVKWRYAKEPLGEEAILDELKWGADQLVQNIKNNNGTTPNSDGTLEAAALAKVARFIPDNSEYIAIADQLLQLAQTYKIKNTNMFRAALDLFMVTKKEEHKTRCTALLPAVTLECPEALIEYESNVDPGGTLSFDLAMALQQATEGLIGMSKNPFGVYTGGTPAKPNFFNTPDHPGAVRQGNSASILAATQIVARTTRFVPSYEMRTFIMDQINWFLGNNPYGVSLIEGLGQVHPPSFSPGCVPGAAISGFMWEDIGVDRPWLDMRDITEPDVATNSARLHNTILYMGVLAHLKRIRMTNQE